MGHIIFVIIHVIALFSGGIFLLLTVPLHLIYGHQREAKNLQRQALMHQHPEMFEKDEPLTRNEWFRVICVCTLIAIPIFYIIAVV